ncbi:uncharacterized protein E0L32_003708 [Thyridium curvatum]|uniref:Uncharacterized protein n=1 Tax=Thyridium curvatum TaxID=1093900 RepID=A0A507BA83_9PEZI|nr:uncharacterized protein E0L32_003708 [Thyridium curvatum]TPX16767.1 hypothetical protein E0L32_003708 [Thyridium curvatum]
MGASMSTYVGWGVIFSLAGFYIINERNKAHKREAAKTAALKQKQEERQTQLGRKETKPKRQRIEPTQRDSYASKLKQEAQPQTYPASYSSDEEVDNREFARQLSNAKQGTNFTSKSKEETRQKSVKQSRAKEMPAPVEKKGSAPSSTTGADADDDQSSVASPSINATKAGDVSDMLEPAGSGPSVLRLTGTEEKKAKEKKTKAPQPTETKKQRQNRRKAEAAKADREEAEKARKVLEEQQRRTARIAEGRAAKDGSAFMASQAASNAWTNNGVNGSSKAAESNFIPVQPLDTFDSKPAPVPNPPKAAATSGDSWVSSLPSEEEQMEAALKDDDAWSTVKTKPRKGKKKDETTESVTTTAPASQPAVAVAAPAVKSQPANGRPAKPFHQTSSFAALSTDDPAEDEDDEEEWDV